MMILGDNREIISSQSAQGGGTYEREAVGGTIAGRFVGVQGLFFLSPTWDDGSRQERWLLAEGPTGHGGVGRPDGEGSRQGEPSQGHCRLNCYGAESRPRTGALVSSPTLHAQCQLHGVSRRVHENS